MIVFIPSISDQLVNDLIFVWQLWLIASKELLNKGGNFSLRQNAITIYIKLSEKAIDFLSGGWWFTPLSQDLIQKPISFPLIQEPIPIGVELQEYFMDHNLNFVLLILQEHPDEPGHLIL